MASTFSVNRRWLVAWCSVPCWSGLQKSFATSLDQSAKVGYLAFDVLLDKPAKESGCLTWLSPPVATLAIESCCGSHVKLVLTSARPRERHSDFERLCGGVRRVKRH